MASPATEKEQEAPSYGALKEIPTEVAKRKERAENAIRGQEPRWQEALCFFNNDQWVEVSAVGNTLDRMETREGGTKPRYRSRLTRNKLTPAVVREVSLLSGRMPRWDCSAAEDHDPDALAQAALAEKALDFEVENLRMRKRVVDTLIYSVMTGCGFAWPFWDSEAGPWVGKEDGFHLGDVTLRVLHQGEVLWEPGVPFEESGWKIVRKAQPLDTVKGHPEYTGDPEMKADARAGLWERPGDGRGELVFVYHYLEEPCAEYRGGRWLSFAGKHLIRREELYPRSNGCCIHELPWIPQPHRHRHLGAGEQLVDVQRTYQRTINQLIAWKNFVLLPQMTAPEGSLIDEQTDESGVIFLFRPVAGMRPEWREVPEIPASVFQTLDRCVEDIADVLGHRDLPPGIDSGTAFQAQQAREMGFRDMFVENMSTWYAGLGEHVLEIIQEKYTEPRLLEVQGRMGVEQIPQFLGRQLGRMGSVRVSPSSIAPRTREAMEARIMQYAERGWVEPQRAMKAIEDASVAELLDDLELDEARQYREIKQLMALGGYEPSLAVERAYQMRAQGIQTFNETVDPLEAEMPSLPMAEDYDNHSVHIDVLTSWMKTREFDQQTDAVKDGARNHLAQHKQLQDQEFMMEAQRAQMKAESLGMGNASRDQAPPKQLPSGPSMATIGNQMAT